MCNSIALVKAFTTYLRSSKDAAVDKKRPAIRNVFCAELKDYSHNNFQVYHPRCVLYKLGWVGPSKHNCLSNVNNKPPDLLAPPHPPHTQPATKSATTPHKDSASQEENGQQPHTATQRTFLRSQHFYTKCLPHTLDYPRKTSKNPEHYKTGRPGRSNPKLVHPAPEHQISRHNTPKGSCPERRGFSVFSFYVYSVFFSDVYKQ